MKQNLFNKVFSFFLSLMVISTSMAPSFQVLAQNEPATETSISQQEETPIPSQDIDEQAAKYGMLMRDISEFKRSVSGALNQEEQQQALELYQQISDYRDQEYERLANKGLSRFKRNQFDAVLEDVQQSLEPFIPAEERPAGFFGFFTDSAEPFAPLEPITPPDFDIPNNPGGFNFPNKDIEVKSLGDILNQNQSPANQQEPIIKKVSQLMIPQAKAQSIGPGLPTLADVQTDDQEIIIDSSIKDLAEDLNNNPVEILNFVRNTIQFEPYYGAKKGNLGCLREQVCNDVDSSSLLISLLRAAGIPAQYKKGPIVAPVEQLQNLLGVESTKTVYAAFSWNNVPVYTVNSALTGDFESADFSNETHLALEWVSVQAYVPYDEAGGNIISILNPDDYSTDQELQDAFLDQENMLWLHIDPVFREYERTANPVLSDVAQMDIPSFWTSFFSSSTTLSPLEKFIADIQSATGQDLNDVNNQSFHEGVETSFDILPPAPPYTVPEATQIPNQTITHEDWPVLPSRYQFQITVSILKASNQTVLLQQQFTGSEANNLPLNILYEGATQADKDLITQYGGIHATPASLVNIVPLLSSDFEQFSGTGSSVSIGEQLLLRFEVGYDNNIDFTDEKFSVAGNSEGIYMVTSQVQRDPSLDSNSKILLEGNPSLAREYISRVFDGDLFARALDQSWNMGFARAVVTQNRILSQVNGTPTTFTFKGLSIDATTYVNNYSNGTQYDQHSTNFRLLLGLESSFQEAQFFKDIAGLDAVSTVNGLQHAFQNPGQYNTYTIDGSNEATIDTLTLSANTKQNMHNDVQDGRTIITADRAISIGNFTGILYISYDPVTGEGRYAIGEQTQNNGGHTNTLLAAADGFYGPYTYEYYDAVNQERTFFQEHFLKAGIYCRVTDQFWNDMRNTPGYNELTHGYPCYSSTFRIGYPNYTSQEGAPGTYTSKVFTRQTYFSKPGDYSYWKHWYDIAVVLVEDMNKDNHQGISNIYLSDNSFQFNVTANTYSWLGTYGSYGNKKYLRNYYQPMSDGRGHGRIVYGDGLSKLEDTHYDPQGAISQNGIDLYKNDIVLRVLGYPISNRFTAAESSFGTRGYYQNFIGGQLYFETNYINESYYVPGEIEKLYNLNNGTNGFFGFPISDPVLFGQNFLSQSFESGFAIDIDLNTSNANIREDKSTIEIIADYGNTHRDLIIEGILDTFSELDLYGLTVNFAAGYLAGELVDLLLRKLVKKLGKKIAIKFAVKFVPFVGWVFTGVSFIAAYYENRPLYDACTSLSYQQNKHPAYYCGRLAANVGANLLGLSTEVAYTRINKYAVNGAAAFLGKKRFFSKVTSNNQWDKIKFGFEKSDFYKRSDFTEIINDFDDPMLEALVTNKAISDIIQDPPKTLNGVVTSGVYRGKLTLKVDPSYSSEFPKYNQPNQFDFSSMKSAGITKDGFYQVSNSVNELDQAIAIYNQNNFSRIVASPGRPGGTSTYGEIAFAMKPDGTLVASPRRNFESLPHPYLVQGSDVISAGVIHVNANNELILLNKTGHYKSKKYMLDIVRDKLESYGYNVIISSYP